MTHAKREMFAGEIIDHIGGNGVTVLSSSAAMLSSNAGKKALREMRDDRKKPVVLI